MWDLNRGIVLLTSVTCGCALIYNAWGTILALAFSLLLVIYICYSLLANDCLISPHAHCILDYLREAVTELSTATCIIITYGIQYLCKFWQNTNRFREFFPFWMDRRRMNSYQLSNDSYTPTAPIVATNSNKRKASAKRKTSSPLSLSTSRFGLIDQLSPIPRYPRSNTNEALMADEKLYHTTFYHAGDHYQQQQQFKHTSTPMFKQNMRKEDSKNGNIDSILHSREVSSKKNSPIYTQNHTLSRGENATQFSPEGSPWGTSISPKIRPRPAGVKTVQTIAGPLLASTRYNIDPKVYTDVTSPGLTTRLTKYATEAKNKLNHQSQYGTGQFPKVNLHASPIPMLSTKLTKSKVPVTVRVAPPDTMKYSPPERQKILSNICHAENKSPTSVVKVLREISLKRHASREDIDFEVIKKQKTESFFGEEREMALEETKQKRTRDDVSKSEEDLSPQSKPTRPAKRTKTRSCYDILNSLSSSIHVVTGVKRKAVDFSRSGTPDFEKHFKSLENAQSNNPSIVSQCQNLDTRYNKSEFKEIYSTIPEKPSCNKSEEFPLMKGILKSYDKDSKVNLNKPTSIIHKTVKSTTIIDDKESTISTEALKFTDKLFMKAEPKRNEQLKVFTEEGNIKANFTSNNVEEIKSEDIRNMRQNSMKARLQSMFDAISGKTERRFNPDVVIQAEDVNTGALPVTCSVTCATLNSSTTTITINTTPLSTAAIVPSGFSSSKIDTKANTKSVAVFKVPNATLSTKLGIQTTNKSEIKEANLPAKIVEKIDQTKTVSIASTVMSTEPLQKIASSVSSATSTFTFDKPTSKVPIITPVISSSLPSFGSSTLNSNTFTAVTTTLTSSTSTNFLATVPAKNQDKTPVSLAFVPINSSANSTTSDVKIETSNIFTSAIISSPNMASTRISSMFTFGSNKSVPVCTSAQTLVSNLLTQTTEISSPVQTTVTNTGFNANSISNTSISNSITPITTTSLFGFKSNATILQAPKSDIFTFGQSSNTNIQTTQAMSLLQNVATTKSFNYTPSTSINANTSFSANATTTAMPVTTIATTTTIPMPTAIPTTTTIPITTAMPTTTAIPAFGLPTTSTFPLSTSVTSTTSSSSKSLFLFGASNTPNVVSTSVTTTATNLGIISNKTIPAFGMPTTIVSQFSTSTTSIFTAMSNTTSSTSIFSTSQPVFGVASRSANIFNTSKTTESPIFASAITSASLSSTAGSNLFSNANTSSTTSTSSVFSTGTLIFGQTKPSTSFGTNTGAMFANTPSLFSSTTQTTSSSTFGNISTSTINPSNFDITNNHAAFGTNVGTATNVQTAPTFGSTTSMFSSTDSTSSVPIFGTNATSSTAGTFGVGSSGANVFGTQNSTSLAFGSTNNSTTFGDGKSLFGTTPTTTAGFGTPSSSIPVFGTSNANNNTNNNTNNMFVFGNNQKDGQQNTFSFGSSFNAGNNNATSSSSTPFQFGSTSTKPASTGFNFTAAAPTINFGTSGTTPTFNPSTPGMFSIGSGSTAPRSRTIRTRKPR